MESITLQRVLPCVFAGKAAPRDSGVWLQEVTFRKGEYCLLKAASGTGKTSLCHFLYGIREDYAGRILFDGADCRGFSAAAWERPAPQVAEYAFPGFASFRRIDRRGRISA